MARPSGQNTTKPSTIRAMVAGVQSGRIRADWFMCFLPNNRRMANLASDHSDVGRAPPPFKETPGEIAQAPDSRTENQAALPAFPPLMTVTGVFFASRPWAA